eukprot:19856-Pelagococcus_subviridis.AAC.1
MLYIDSRERERVRFHDDLISCRVKERKSDRSSVRRGLCERLHRVQGGAQRVSSPRRRRGGVHRLPEPGRGRLHLRGGEVGRLRE